MSVGRIVSACPRDGKCLPCPLPPFRGMGSPPGVGVLLLGWRLAVIVNLGVSPPLPPPPQSACHTAASTGTGVHKHISPRVPNSETESRWGPGQPVTTGHARLLPGKQETKDGGPEVRPHLNADRHKHLYADTADTLRKMRMWESPERLSGSCEVGQGRIGCGRVRSPHRQGPPWVEPEIPRHRGQGGGAGESPSGARSTNVRPLRLRQA